MKAHDDILYLRHILDATNRIERYLQRVSEEQFGRQELLQDGVIRQLEIIGEATRHLSPDLRGQYTEVPWQDIAGMRDKLIHDYLGVDIGLVWLTAKEDVPVISSSVIRLYPLRRSHSPVASGSSRRKITVVSSSPGNSGRSSTQPYSLSHSSA